jgi:hypothetical protein
MRCLTCHYVETEFPGPNDPVVIGKMWWCCLRCYVRFKGFNS